MSEIKETQEGMFLMKWRNFIPMMVLIIAGTNTASVFWQEQKHDKQQIQYNKERTDRKIENERERNQFILDNRFLKLQLQECKDSK